MMRDEMAAQEAAAREYQPRLEVRFQSLPSFCLWRCVFYRVCGSIERLVVRWMGGWAAMVAVRMDALLTILQGPLVGDRVPSSAISEEYAKADPIYVEKTMVRR